MGTVPNDREHRSVLARPDDAIIIVRRDPDLRSGVDGSRVGLQLTYDHVAGSDPQPVVLVRPVAFGDLALWSWLSSQTAEGHHSGGEIR